jgi:hypothetical protein
MMLRQNRYARECVRGLRDLWSASSKIPRCWLLDTENVKSHPNENFGREPLELFTMGVGNYTERDGGGRTVLYR